jgi:hypothetical protein
MPQRSLDIATTQEFRDASGENHQRFVAHLLEDAACLPWSWSYPRIEILIWPPISVPTGFYEFYEFQFKFKFQICQGRKLADITDKPVEITSLSVPKMVNRSAAFGSKNTQNWLFFFKKNWGSFFQVFIRHIFDIRTRTLVAKQRVSHMHPVAQISGSTHT